MGRQTGVHKMLGTVDELTYYKTAESGLLVRKKSSLNKERVANDPAFEKSRKASKEFGRASLAAKLMRSTMAIGGYKIADNRIYSRLTGLLQGVIATDKMHPKGDRTLDSAELSKLLDFQWNKYKALAGVYSRSKELKFSIDPKTGLMEIDSPGMNGPADFDPPTGATHVQLIMEGAGFDFGLGEGVGITDTTKWLSLEKKHPVQTLSGTLALKPGMRLVLGIGVRFGQEVSGSVSELNNRLNRAFVVGAIV